MLRAALNCQQSCSFDANFLPLFQLLRELLRLPIFSSGRGFSPFKGLHINPLANNFIFLIIIWILWEQAHKNNS